MTQRDYILRIAEQVGRVLARVLYNKQQQDYQGAHEFIDEQFRQMLGMGAGFVHSAPVETLLAMLTSMGALDVERCWLLATLLKADGEIYEAQGDEDGSYYCYLKALNLFLAVLAGDDEQRKLDPVAEVEGLLYKLSNYELPTSTKMHLLRYFEQTGSFANAENILFELLDADPANDEMKEAGRALYRRLLQLDDATLAAGGLSRDEVEDGLLRLMREREGHNDEIS
jgi:tetratricopeptide (TPR) repeat protein